MEAEAHETDGWRKQKQIKGGREESGKAMRNLGIGGRAICIKQGGLYVVSRNLGDKQKNLG